MAVNPEDIEQFRKDTEDLVQANVRAIFQVKYGELSMEAGDNTINLSGDAYPSDSVYEIRFHQATDSDGIDIRDAISIEEKTVDSFTINTPRAGTLRWVTFLKTPQFNFWT
jgi:hypothetical protein